MTLHYDELEIDQDLPELVLPPISRTTLALFAGASGDHNPIHIDLDFARAVGMSDVFAHGMLSMAYLGRLLTQWVAQPQIKQFNVRFADITLLGDVPCCTGKIVEKQDINGEKCIKVKIQVANQQGQVKIVGDALIAC